MAAGPPWYIVTSVAMPWRALKPSLSAMRSHTAAAFVEVSARLTVVGAGRALADALLAGVLLLSALEAATFGRAGAGALQATSNAASRPAHWSGRRLWRRARRGRSIA